MFSAPEDFSSFSRLGSTGECLKAWLARYDLEDGFLEVIEGNVRESQDSDGDLGSNGVKPSEEPNILDCFMLLTSAFCDCRASTIETS